MAERNPDASLEQSPGGGFTRRKLPSLWGIARDRTLT